MQQPDPAGTIFRTPAPYCPACKTQRLHTADERKGHHPLAGHGFDRGQWSHPLLDPGLIAKFRADPQMIGKLREDRAQGQERRQS